MIRPLTWLFSLLILAAPLHGTDLEVSTRVDNIYWNPGKTDDTSGTTFTGSDVFWNLQGSVTQDLGDGVQFKGGVAIDPILRWRAYSQVGFTFDNLTLKFAPFLGIFNTYQKWFIPGMEANVEYTWPGFLFVRGGFLTTFSPVSTVGDYYLSSLSASVGTMVENGIITFNIENKSATFRTSDPMTTIDTATKYWLDTEMFIKNFPLKWAFLTGYQVTDRTYVTTSESVETPVHSFLLGARFSWDCGNGTLVYVQGETSLFNVGWYQTTMAVPSNTPLFDLNAGVRYHW